jgi:hypothetical protein
MCGDLPFLRHPFAFMTCLIAGATSPVTEFNVLINKRVSELLFVFIKWYLVVTVLAKSYAFFFHEELGRKIHGLYFLNFTLTPFLSLGF